MPHDRNGVLLAVGDEVLIPARIKTIQPSENYCNLSVETLDPMPPYTDAYSLTLNAKQVVKGSLPPVEAT